jgi:hypothetical protein
VKYPVTYHPSEHSCPAAFGTIKNPERDIIKISNII